MSGQQELTNYEEDSEPEEEQQEEQGAPKGDYANIHDAGFKDFELRKELLSAITDCSFEHPSAVQHEVIPRAIIGLDVLCQAKAGMGKTAVFVIATIHQLASPENAEELKKNKPLALCIAHTHELAGQINSEFKRFLKFLPDIRTTVFYGGPYLNKTSIFYQTFLPPTIVQRCLLARALILRT